MKSDREIEIVQHTDMNPLKILVVDMTKRSPHGHDDFEIGMILAGGLFLFIEQVQYELHEGDIYIINRYQVHSFLNTGNHNRILAFQINSGLLRKINSGFLSVRFREPVIHPGPLHDRLSEQLKRCADCYYSETGFRELRCTGLIFGVLSDMLENCSYDILSQKESANAKKTTRRLNRITEYIQENFAERISLSDIAARESLNEYYISHFIRNTLGMSFQEYLNQFRFECALQLLNKTDLNIVDISLEAGFSSTRYLNILFEKNFGCSVREYRKNLGRPHTQSVMQPAGNIQALLTHEQAAEYIRKYTGSES